jgi:hypothetical protein
MAMARVETAKQDLGGVRKPMYARGYGPILHCNEKQQEKTLFWEFPWLNSEKPKDIVPLIHISSSRKKLNVKRP